MKRLTFLMFILFGIIAYLVPVSIAQSCNANETAHVVQAGQNLYRISLQYSQKMRTIARRNNIADRDVIYVGQTLCIHVPRANRTTSSTSTNASQAVLTRDNEYNWCLDPAYWGDGRCNTNNSGVTDYMYRVGWYMPRILLGQIQLSEAEFLFDEMDQLGALNRRMIRDLRRKLRRNTN